MGKVYVGVPGRRTEMGGFPIYVYPNEKLILDERKELDPRPSQAIQNHSPDGFNWGYGGSGPSQCALGILLDATGDRATALRWYHDFEWDFIAKMPREMKWTLDASVIKQWLKAKQEQKNQ